MLTQGSPTREQTNALWLGDFEERPYVLHEDRPVGTHLSAFIDCLHRSFSAWLDVSYHQRTHSETGQTPQQR
ncbi:MAG: hypothetical protein EA424_22725 [Planctomycetaceae bacterium]|nr:MAG: hypothetical protein EA424_22725 [Planctomycetaceae bacterium]